MRSQGRRIARLCGGEKCEKCQEILAAMSKLQATTVSARSGAPCCSGDQDRPSTTAMETHDLTPLPAVGELVSTQNKPVVFHQLIPRFEYVSPARREVYEQFGYL